MALSFSESPEHHDLATLAGQVERITYTDPVSHFTVARLQVKGRRELVTVVGSLTGIQEGERLRLKGRWVIHPRFGEQFQVVWWTSVVPATVSGICKYLGSGFIRGIGPELANRLVTRFGAQALDIIDNAPERLQEVPGIGRKRARQIRAAWEGQKEIREVMLFLQDHGISVAYATKIYKQYGSQAIQVVTANPYQLATDVYGIGFLTADRIAARLHIDRQSPARLAAGLLYTLDQFAKDGHVYAPRHLLINRAGQLLQAEPPLLEAALQHQAQEGNVVIERLADREEGVYRKAFFIAETGIVQRLTQLRKGLTRTAPPLGREAALEWVQSRRNLRLSADQSQAVSRALTEKGLIITGGPGTGKTTIISCILDIFQSLGARVTLLAPTGRAAKRLSEATGSEARTIHRGLEFSPQTGGFRHNATNPLKTDVVIIDEVSMVDTILMYHLLKALPAAARLILVGDAYQLPSVGPGNVIKDLLDSGVIPVVRLKEIYRQARQSLIVVNAHRINQGRFPIIPRHPQKSDFFFWEIEDLEVLRERLLELVVIQMPRHYGFDPVKDIQVLSPMHRGRVGIQDLNQELQTRLNSPGTAWQGGGRTFKLHDKVMQLRNNYTKEVFNGDIGQVCGYDPENQWLKVDFEGREVAYEPAEWDELTLAYAVSIHKAQGNEFPGVVIALTTHHYLMLQRNLLYTAITRGKQVVALLGSKRALAMAINNDRPLKRYTFLASRLGQSLAG